jgi:hypothetical protein
MGLLYLCSEYKMSRFPICPIFPCTISFLKEDLTTSLGMPMCPTYLFWRFFILHYCSIAIFPYHTLTASLVFVIFGFVRVLEEINQAFAR